MLRHTQTVIFIALVALVALRPLVSETFDYRTDSISLALTDLASPTPVRTLMFGAVILLCALGWLVTRSIGTPTPYRRTGLEWGTVVLTLAAVISCVAAGQRRVAITASLDWLCLPVLAITLTQLMRSRLHRRVLLACVLATACVEAFHAFEQYFVGFDETWRAYQAGKVNFWASQGVSLDSTKVQMFERRILAHEASGTFDHSNVAGSYLVLCGISALGLAISLWRGRGDGDSALRLLGKIGAGLCAAILLAAVWLTGSVGAIITGVAGVIALLVAWRYQTWIDRHRRRLFVAGWAAFLFACAATIGHGVYHGSLPGSSLNFRWQYWVNTTGMIADYPATGVGRENFGNHYLAYKSIESPEEVSNPHNLFVQASSEWGLLGLAGVVMMLLGLARVMTKTARYSHREGDPERCCAGSDCRLSSTTAAAALMMVGTVVVAGRLALSGSSQGAYLYYIGMVTALAWVTGTAVFSMGSSNTRTTTDPSAHHPPDLMGTGVAVAALAFGVHELVNFAVFVPAAGTTLFALIAVGCAEAPCSKESKVVTQATPSRRFFAPLVGTVVLACVYVLAIRPPVRSDRLLAQADAQIGHPVPGTLEDQPANRLYQSATDADPLDPYPFRKWLGWLRQAATVPPWHADAESLAEAAIESAIERDPFNASLRRQQMNYYRERAALDHNTNDLRKAIEAAEAALALYPQHPQSIAALADCRSAAGTAEGNTTLLTQALDGYRAALALDDRRLKWEQLHRFSKTQTETLRMRIQKVEQTLNRLHP